MRIAILTAALLTAPAVQAQTAIVASPEITFGVSFAQSVQEAIEFATDECIYFGVEQGFEEAEMIDTCQVATVCAYGDWTIEVWLGGEIHWTEFYCGLPSEAAARGLADLICDPADRTDIFRCELVQIYDRGRPLIEY